MIFRDFTTLTLKSSTLGESPPPAPRACFGRDELIGEIIDLAVNLTPIALTGAGGIGKTSIALTVLHHDRIKEKFGEDRRFIRCDQFPASRANILRRLSKVIGADVENPGDLSPLRPFLTSKEMVIVLDNAESILDPQGAGGQGIYAAVEELSRFSNICLFITSRITTIPPDCRTFETPTLSMRAARDAFYWIYTYDRQSDFVDDILEQLDFHPLSATLLATVAHQNKWDNSRLAKEWSQRQTGALQKGYNKSLSHAIELSLASSMFGELGPDARGLLEVIAFFPQGIDENNLDWLFPTVSDRATIFDTFCVLSLTHRNNGFITMLAPLRDYLRPQDPMSSPLLCATKDRYFTRMDVELNPGTPVFRKSRWIGSEDLNVEHLLDVFTSADANTDGAWNACANFMSHLRQHKPRRTVLSQKIEGLPDGHQYKTLCLFNLAHLLYLFGDFVERKRILNYILKLEREGGSGHSVARILANLAETNRMLGLHKEAIQQAKEASEMYHRVGIIASRVWCLTSLAWSLYYDGQLDAAKEATSQVIDLLPEKGQEHLACQSHRILGEIYRSEGERDKAIHHLETALAIVSPLGLHDQLSWIHYALARLFLDEREFDSAQTHVEQAKSHAVEGTYKLVSRCSYRLGFGISKAGSKRPGPRLCAPPRRIRKLVWRRI